VDLGLKCATARCNRIGKGAVKAVKAVGDLADSEVVVMVCVQHTGMPA
jgi:hypothetical protein